MLFYTLHHMSFVYFSEDFCQVWELLKSDPVSQNEML